MAISDKKIKIQEIIKSEITKLKSNDIAWEKINNVLLEASKSINEEVPGVKQVRLTFNRPMSAHELAAINFMRSASSSLAGKVDEIGEDLKKKEKTLYLTNNNNALKVCDVILSPDGDSFSAVFKTRRTKYSLIEDGFFKFIADVLTTDGVLAEAIKMKS